MENKTSINHENGNDANRLLAAVLEYVKNEGIGIYDTRMDDDVDYDSVMSKVDAFKIVENHVKKQLKNGC
jgi:hypothetical protein